MTPPALPPGSAPLFELAVREHRASRFAPAEKIYRDLLAREPGHPDCLHLLGLLTHQTDRPGAEELIRQALAIMPHEFYHDSLANVLLEHGRFAEAEEHYRRSLALRSDYPEAHSELRAAAADAGPVRRGLAALRMARAPPGTAPGAAR